MKQYREVKGKCKSCPMWIDHEDGIEADNAGCLPTLADAMQWHRETGKIWACHSAHHTPCKGFLAQLDKKGIEYDLDSPLITEQSTHEEIYKP